MANPGWPWTMRRIMHARARSWRVHALLWVGGFALGAAAALVAGDGPPHTEPGAPRAERLHDWLSARQAVSGSCARALAAAVVAADVPIIRRDPWGNRWVVRCFGERLVVRSIGPDGVPGTPDDVVVGAPHVRLGAAGPTARPPRHRRAARFAL